MIILNLGFEHANRLVRGRRQRFARSQAKSRAVTRANNFIALDLTAGQLRPVMGADVLNCKIVLAAANQGDHATPHGNGFGRSVR